MRRVARDTAGTLGLILWLACVGGGSGGCRCAAEEREATVRVWAPASLVDVLPEVTEAWRRSGETPVELSFGATSRLARQVVDGAPADLFLAADPRWMDYAVAHDAVRSETRTEVLRNTLVVAVPDKTRSEWRTLKDLGEADVRRLAIGGPAVPVGRYAEAALREAAVWNAVRERAIRADHARAVLAWVARGEVDAGLVYRTDALAEPSVRIAFDVPASLHPPIVYAAAVTRQAAHPEPARRLLAFIRGPEAREHFVRAGFRPVERQR